MSRCSIIIRTGPAFGEKCPHSPLLNGICNIHQHLEPCSDKECHHILRNGNRKGSFCRESIHYSPLRHHYVCSRHLITVPEFVLDNDDSIASRTRSK